MPTCALHVATDVVVSVSAFAGLTTWPSRFLSTKPWSAPNLLQAHMTNSVVSTIGGR